MSIEPGYSGHAFLEASLERIRWSRDNVPQDIQVQVDGGIGEENIRSVHDAGASLLVSASAIFSREDLPRAYRRLVQALA